MLFTKLLTAPLLCCFLCGFVLSATAQVKPDKVTIARDEWGVPHIFAATDAGVAYGLAWATAEDDFKTMQEQLLPIRGLAGRVLGRSGAIMDVAVHLLGSRELVAARFEHDLSAEFREVLAAYAAGINAYAAAYPKEVLHRKLFPVTAPDIVEAYVLGVSLMAGIDRSLGAILSEELPVTASEGSRGSNAFAFSKRKTKDGKTHLVINSHQPLEGMNSWYEAHLCSDEGLNVLGATFPGGVSIFVGANPYLGWGHTVNYPDLADIYQLSMHPTENDLYRFDGRWERLEPYHTKARVKLLGLLTIGVRRKFYRSKYGVTFKTDQGVFALRFPAAFDIRAAEQWYRMNKATDWASFRQALEIQGIGCTNIVYADHDDHIYYLGNGRFPKRHPEYDWQGILPGDTSATLWTEFYPLDSLVQVLDPPSGYVYNCNHTPFFATGPQDNPDPDTIPHTMGYQAPDILTNRAARFAELISTYDQLSYDDIKRIKYDLAYTEPLHAYPKLEPIFALDPALYPDIRSSLQLLRNWDRIADTTSTAASVFVLSLNFLLRHPELDGVESLRSGPKLDTAKLVAAVRHAQEHLQQHFGRSEVTLGQLQRHARGDVQLAYAGAPDVLAAVYSRPTPEGWLRPVAGDSYIQFVRFGENGVEIESINAYGASAKEGSPHYTDQMVPFARRQLKPMTLDKEQVLREAVRIYHPKE